MEMEIKNNTVELTKPTSDNSLYYDIKKYPWYRSWPYYAITIGLTIIIFSLIIIIQNPGMKAFLLFWLPMPIYTLHQFEEHAIDYYGEEYAFQSCFCQTLGFNILDKCPGSPWFIFCVNVCTLWIAAIITGLTQSTVLLASFIGIIFVNAIVHIAYTIHFHKYNPGLATAITIFLPVALFYFIYIRNKYKLGFNVMLLSIITGILIHIVFVASIKAVQYNFIDQYGLGIINILNGFTPLLLALISDFKIM
jgi:hypothetical protein